MAGNVACVRNTTDAYMSIRKRDEKRPLGRLVGIHEMRVWTEFIRVRTQTSGRLL
jgi:hypothetical protein